MPNRFASGKKAIAECDVCGQRFKLKQLRRLVVKTKTTNILACPECWSPDHPQLQLGMYPVDDPQALRNPRPDTSYSRSGTNNIGFPGEGSRVIQWGWNPVGLNNPLGLRGLDDALSATASVGVVMASSGQDRTFVADNMPSAIASVFDVVVEASEDIGPDGTFVVDGVLYGPNYRMKGPTKFLVSVWNQNPVGYCRETDNISENLYAKWKSRGVNTIKHQHPDFPLAGNAANVLAAVQAEGLMMIASPRWQTELFNPRPTALDYRSLAINDPYWRVNWIGYAFADEPDLYTLPQIDHENFFAGHTLDGVSKPGVVNFTGRIASPTTPAGSSTINWRPFFELNSVREIDHDVYIWHSIADDGDVDAGVSDINGNYFLSTWNLYGPYNTAVDPSLVDTNKLARGRRFTASYVGMATHLSRSGPMTRGYSEDGGVTILPPAQFNTPPGTRGVLQLPTPLSYAPGDKAVGHYVGTGRVDMASSFFPRGGLYSPARFTRDCVWTGVVHGSSHLLIFPQAPAGGIRVTGYTDAATDTFVCTSLAPSNKAVLQGAIRVTPATETFPAGWIRVDNPQLSGTPFGVGTYALDPTKFPTLNRGSAGTPIEFILFSEESFASDGTNPDNAAEITTATANFTRMQAHPTGGNLLMDTLQGGRRAFTTLRCPDINGNARAYKTDMTRAPIQAGYTSGGTPILDSAGEGPGWQFGWPMGFEGFHVTGDDGAVYIYVKSMSNGDRPTWFPGYAPLGLPARVFGPFELAGFRRVGTGSAVEMTGDSAVIKSAVDQGAATWFYIETVNIVQNEGNSGTTAYNVVVRRGGNTSSTNTVTATVSATGFSPANPADFQGGVFPSETLSFAAGETSKTFTVNVNGDTSAEVDETFAVTLSAPSGGAALVASGKDTITCTITNDDAALVGAFVWLGQSLTAAPSLPGSPPGATYLNFDESAFVTRGGVKMRAATGFASNTGFASAPYAGIDNVFQRVEFELTAGNWEVGIIAQGNASGSGTLKLIDDPAGAATERYSYAMPASGSRLLDTDGTAYTDAGTAVAEAVNNLTYVTVAVSDLGGGVGILRVGSTTSTLYLSAVALRQV